MEESKVFRDEAAGSPKAPNRYGHWFLYREARQQEADQLVFAVVNSLAGKANYLDFKPLMLRATVTGKGRVMSLAEAIRIARTVRETLACPVYFVEMGGTWLQLVIAHPILVEDHGTDPVRWLQMMPIDDWIAGVTAPLQP
jgi:hypothetical protein